MQWQVGQDHIHRASIGNVHAEISMCSGRSSWRVRIFEDGKCVFNNSPYFKMQRARKAAENYLRRLTDSEQTEADICKQDSEAIYPDAG